MRWVNKEHYPRESSGPPVDFAWAVNKPLWHFEFVVFIDFCCRRITAYPDWYNPWGEGFLCSYIWHNQRVLLMLNFRHQNLLSAITQENFFVYIQTLQFTNLPFSFILTMLEKLVGVVNSEKISYFLSLTSMVPQTCLESLLNFSTIPHLVYIISKICSIIHLANCKRFLRHEGGDDFVMFIYDPTFF